MRSILRRDGPWVIDDETAVEGDSEDNLAARIGRLAPRFGAGIAGQYTSVLLIFGWATRLCGRVIRRDSQRPVKPSRPELGRHSPA